jgi:hypothetical protein
MIMVEDIIIKARILIGHFLTDQERKREKWKDKIKIKWGEGEDARAVPRGSSIKSCLVRSFSIGCVRISLSLLEIHLIILVDHCKL